MTKSPISDKFAKFAAKTTRGEFDKARKQESMLSGCPLPLDTKGTAIVGEIKCSETKVKADGSGGDPIVTIKLEVETPEEYRGKHLSGPGLMYLIKDGQNSSAADAWARMLDSFELMGLPREIREGYEDFAEVVDWFTDEPRRVDFSVNKDSWSGNSSGKTVRAVAHVAEADIPTAVTPSSQETVELDPEADYCEYQGKKYKILAFDRDNNLYDIEQVSTGRIRKGVEGDKIKLD
jgi:hypothetical protein